MIFNLSNPDTFMYNTTVYAELNFSPSMMVKEQTYVRTNIIAVVSGLGSILYILRNLGNAVTKNGNRF